MQQVWYFFICVACASYGDDETKGAAYSQALWLLQSSDAPISLGIEQALASLLLQVPNTQPSFARSNRMDVSRPISLFMRGGSETSARDPSASTPILLCKPASDGVSVGDCPFTHFARMALHLAGMPYSVRPTTLADKPAWHMQQHKGSMPCLCPAGFEDGTGAISESHEIALQALAPSAADEVAFQIIKDVALFPSIAKLIKNNDAQGQGEDLLLRASLREALIALEAHLENSPFFGGETIGVADASISTKLYVIDTAAAYYKDFHINADEFPRLAAYKEKVFRLPAFVSTKYAVEEAILGWGEARRRDGQAIRMLPRVLYEDAHVLAVYKPADLSYHSETSPGLLKTVRFLQNTSAIAYKGELHSVHRLDKITSGIVLFAKTEHIQSLLSTAFANGHITKYYIGLSDRKPKKKMGTVKGDLRKGNRGEWLLSRNSKTPAITRFKSFGVDGKDGRQLRAFVFRPLTGKTHQLRATAKSLGSFILGDVRYGTKSPETEEDRAYLHAAAIRVPPLWEGEKALQIISAPLEGREWLGSSWFKDLFPEELALDEGEWFDGDKILFSKLDGT